MTFLFGAYRQIPLYSNGPQTLFDLHSYRHPTAVFCAAVPPHIPVSDCPSHSTSYPITFPSTTSNHLSRRRRLPRDLFRSTFRSRLHFSPRPPVTTLPSMLAICVTPTIRSLLRFFLYFFDRRRPGNTNRCAYRPPCFVLEQIPSFCYSIQVVAKKKVHKILITTPVLRLTVWTVRQ